MSDKLFVPDRPRTYIAIDLKSFYASAECADRGFDPLTTNLVVADPGRTEKPYFPEILRLNHPEEQFSTSYS